MGRVDVLLDARARALRDLEARGLATAAHVSRLEEAISERGWWSEQWPEGRAYVAGLVAQDLQDALFDEGERWPICTACDERAPLHSLTLTPDLGGPDPTWVCEESGRVIAPLGQL